jgi:hypothetical protein
VILILASVLIIGGISYFLFIHNPVKSNTKDKSVTGKIKQWNYAGNFHKYSIEIPSQNNFSFYAEFNTGRKSDFFFAASIDSFLYPANDNQIIPIIYKNKNYSLINVNFPFINRKENIVPYLNGIYLIKVLHLYDLVKFRTFLTDAIRTYKDQMKYNRRGWSTVDKSPHMAGLASDMGRYFGAERKIVEAECEKLGIKFLQHGGRGNVHIHLQDNTLWQKKELVDNLVEISDEMHREVEKRNNIIIGYEKTESRKLFTENYFKKYGKSIHGFDGENMYNFNFYMYKPVVLKSEIYNTMGINIATLYSGVYKNLKNTFLLDLKFLPQGVYKIKHSVDSRVIKEEIIKRF